MLPFIIYPFDHGSMLKVELNIPNNQRKRVESYENCYGLSFSSIDSISSNYDNQNIIPGKF